MRSRPLSMLAMLVAKERRTWLGAPKSSPGTTATFACSSSEAAKIAAGAMKCGPYRSKESK
jgi:hypothetical protein